jgi:hypothetical protein
MAEQQVSSSMTGVVDRVASNSDASFESVSHCSLCGRMIEGRYATVNNKIACVTCAARERDASRRMNAPSASSVRPSGAQAPAAIGSSEEAASPFLQSVIFGAGAALLGLILYASFTIITHWYFGYVALGVGWLVGKAMMQGSGGLGGPRYQAVAVALTYAAISLASIPIHLFRAVNEGVAIDWATMWGPLLLGGIASPFLALARGTFGIISLAILFTGLRVAFRITREKPLKAIAR